jgi:hypothetical protein
MQRRFRVAVVGDPQVLDVLFPRLQTPTLTLERDGSDFYLVSSAFESMADRAEVYAAANRMLPRITAAARMAGLRPRALTAPRVEEQTPNGPATTSFAGAGVAAAIAAAHPPPFAGAAPPPPPPSIPVDRAQNDDRVDRALALYARDPTFVDLYKFLDVIDEDVAPDSIVSKGWASAPDIKRMKGTANNLRALGLDARHAIDAWQPPRVPMTLDEATALVGRVLEAWLNTK